MKNIIYGYCRISTMKQSIARQIDNIKNVYPNAVIISEEFTGTKMDRPKWNKLYDNVKQGDTIVFDEVSRLSRNADEGFKVYQELFNRGVNLIFLKESTLNTDNFKNEVIKRIGKGRLYIDVDAFFAWVDKTSKAV